MKLSDFANLIYYLVKVVIKRFFFYINEPKNAQMDMKIIFHDSLLKNHKCTMRDNLESIISEIRQ